MKKGHAQIVSESVDITDGTAPNKQGQKILQLNNTSPASPKATQVFDIFSPRF